MAEDTGDSWFEPTDSDAINGRGKPQSPYNSVRGTEAGHYEEWDSTPGNERIRFQHSKGSFQEYQASGNVVHKIVGNNYTIVLNDQKVSIAGKCSVQILGDLELHVGGDMHLIVEGDFKKTVKGNHNSTVKGDHTHDVEGTHQATASDVKHQSTGDLTISGNLNVRGDIIGQQTVSALGNLTAGGHLSIQGSINAEGNVPKTGGEPLPHTISGIFPGLGMMVDLVGPIDISTADSVLVDSGIDYTNSAGGAIGINAGGEASLDAGGVVNVTGTLINLN